MGFLLKSLCLCSIKSNLTSALAGKKWELPFFIILVLLKDLYYLYMTVFRKVILSRNLNPWQLHQEFTIKVNVLHQCCLISVFEWESNVIGIFGLKVRGSNPVSNSFSASVKFIGKWVNNDSPPPPSNLDDRFQDCFFPPTLIRFFIFLFLFFITRWSESRKK